MYGALAAIVLVVVINIWQLISSRQLRTLDSSHHVFFFFSNYITKTCPCFKHQIFHGCKKDDFQMKSFDVLVIFAQNTHCGYRLALPQLEPPH